MKNKISAFIVAALILGTVVGLACHSLAATDETRATITTAFDTITHMFLNLVKMVIAPLIFATIVSGITGATKSSGLGRLFARSIVWFLAASTFAGAFGFAIAHLLGVGKGLNLVDTGAASAIETTALNYSTFLSELIPTSVFKALAENKPMQILIFGMFFGAALLALKRVGHSGIAAAVDELTTVMLKITGYVMMLAPVGVFAAVASAFTTQGFEAFTTYGTFIASFYTSLAGLWLVLIAAGSIFLGRGVFRLVSMLREPMFIAFSTSSTEAAFPRLIECLTSYGVDRRTTGFVLPLGYAFNIDGSMMYMTFASVFLINAYGVELSMGQQLLMVLILMLSSKGMAGVPRGSLVIVAAVVPGFGIPVAGIAVLLAVDQILDMGRTATNILGNGIATAVLGRKPPVERDVTNEDERATERVDIRQ